MEHASSSAQASDAKNATLEHELLCSQERVADLAAASAAAQNTISALEEKLNALNAHKGAMLDRVASIESQLVDAAERASNKHTTDRNKLKATVAQLTAQTEQLTSALGLAHAELRDERARVRDSRDAHHVATTTAQERQDELDAQRERFEGALARAAAAQAEAADEAVAARRRAAEALARSKDANRSIARLKADLVHTQERLDAATADARELQTTRKLLVQTTSRLKREQARAAAAASAVAVADAGTQPSTEHKHVQTEHRGGTPPSAQRPDGGAGAALSPRSMHKLLSQRKQNSDPDASMDRIGQLVFAYNALKDRHSDLQLELQLVSHKVQQAESARATEHAARRNAEVQRDALERQLRSSADNSSHSHSHSHGSAGGGHSPPLHPPRGGTNGAFALGDGPAPPRVPPVPGTLFSSRGGSSGANLLAGGGGGTARSASPGPYVMSGRRRQSPAAASPAPASRQQGLGRRMGASGSQQQPLQRW